MRHNLGKYRNFFVQCKARGVASSHKVGIFSDILVTKSRMFTVYGHGTFSMHLLWVCPTSRNFRDIAVTNDRVRMPLLP